MEEQPEVAIKKWMLFSEMEHKGQGGGSETCVVYVRGVCDVKRKISPYILRRCVMGLEERKIRFQMCATTSAQTERVQF